MKITCFFFFHFFCVSDFDHVYRMEKIRMFTAKVSQMDYRSSLKQIKKYELEDKKEYEVSYKIEVKPESSLCDFIFSFFFSHFQGKPEWAFQKEKSVVSEREGQRVSLKLVCNKGAKVFVFICKKFQQKLTNFEINNQQHLSMSITFMYNLF